MNRNVNKPVLIAALAVASFFATAPLTSLTAQTFTSETLVRAAPAHRYFVSTNLLTLATLTPNIGLEVRFPNEYFALKTNLFAGAPW